MLSSQVEYDTIIPNNVSLSSDRRVLKALEKWHPGYIDWWKDLGPVGFLCWPIRFIYIYNIPFVGYVNKISA